MFLFSCPSDVPPLNLSKSSFLFDLSSLCPTARRVSLGSHSVSIICRFPIGHKFPFTFILHPFPRLRIQEVSFRPLVSRPRIHRHLPSVFVFPEYRPPTLLHEQTVLKCRFRPRQRPLFSSRRVKFDRISRSSSCSVRGGNVPLFFRPFSNSYLARALCKSSLTAPFFFVPVAHTSVRAHTHLLRCLSSLPFAPSLCSQGARPLSQGGSPHVCRWCPI